MTNRRKVLIINAVQQRRLIMGSVLVAIILVNSLAIFTVLMNPPFLEVIETTQTLGLAGLEIVIVSVIGYFSLILSHKIAGPAYAVARDLKKLGSGDLTVHTRLRKGDFHMEVAEALNNTVDTLCGKIKSVKASLVILQQQPHVDESTRQSLKVVLNDLSYFKTEPAPAGNAPSAAPASNVHETMAIAGADKPRSGG